MSSYKNVILNALYQAEPDFVRERTAPFSFVHGDRLVEAGTLIDQVYFPQSGLISLVVNLATGEHIEIAMIGREGAVGASAGCGATVAMNTGFAQIAGRGWCMAAADLAALAQRHSRVQSLLLRHERFVLAQAQQTAACNARHLIPARLCSWFMRANDAVGHDELHVTQEFLAQILGVQRASVSLIAGTLQDAGLIQYRRGRLSIVDKDGLANKACECYHALRGHHHRLFCCDHVETFV